MRRLEKLESAVKEMLEKDPSRDRSPARARRSNATHQHQGQVMPVSKPGHGGRLETAQVPRKASTAAAPRGGAEHAARRGGAESLLASHRRFLDQDSSSGKGEQGLYAGRVVAGTRDFPCETDAMQKERDTWNA